jgi:hypothetical protein
VPPSTIFATAPTSFYPSGPVITKKAKDKQKATEDDMDVDAIDNVEKPARLTLVGIQKGEGLKKGNEGKALWVWRGEEGAEKEVVSVRAPARHAQGAELTLVAENTYTLDTLSQVTRCTAAPDISFGCHYAHRRFSRSTHSFTVSCHRRFDYPRLKNRHFFSKYITGGTR